MRANASRLNSNDFDEALKFLGYKSMKGPDKEKVEDKSENASAKSLRFAEGNSRPCSNPLCRLSFTPKRKDQRFCGRNCKEAFFKVKYALLTLAP